MNWIIDRLNAISLYFWYLYYDSYDWGFPFDLLHVYFLEISDLFNSLAWNFSYFADWVQEIQFRVNQILGIDDIWDAFSSFFQAGSNAWEWIANAWWNVTDIVDNWWSSTRYTVLAWVDEAKSYAASLVDEVNTWLASLQSAWDDFKGRIPSIDEVIYWWSNWTGNVLAVINTWWTGALTEVQSLINSAFIERESWWAGWQDWRDKVTEFFTDPEDWLYKAADRIVERFW